MSYSNVDSHFPTNGFGNTRSTFSNSGDNYSGTHSIGRNDGSSNRYLYRNVALSANTTYTISVYAAARNSARINDTDAVDRLRFAYRRSGGSDVFSPYQTITNYITPNSASSTNWKRYYWTFTTTNATTYSVGIVAPNLNGDYTALWGIQLEEGTSPSRYIFTYNAVTTAPTNTLMTDPSSGALPQGESAVYTAQVTITQDMMDTATEISNQVTITGSFTSPGGISGTTFDVSADNDNSDGNTEDDPTIITLDVTNQLEVTKTATTTDINGNGQIDAGDKINYEITIENIGNTSLKNFTVTDTLTRSSGVTVTQFTDTSSFTLKEVKNLFKYSNYQDDTYNDWNEQGDIYGNPLNSWGYPVDEPYYFSTNSGDSYSNVDYYFQTNGLGRTRSPLTTGGDNRSGAHSRMHDYNVVGRYYYQDISLEANTEYTVSVYANAWNANYDDAVVEEQFRFVFRPPGGSDTFSQYNTMPTYINDWSFERYSYTFTTGAAGTYRVGIDPPYAQGNGGRFWGAQLEKGSTATTYIYTWSNQGVKPSDALPISANTTTTYIEWVGGYPNRNGIDALMIRHDSNGTKYTYDYPIGNGYRSIIEVEPQNLNAFNNRPNANYFDNGYIGEFNGHRYYLETTGWNWSTHNNNANQSSGYLFVPNTKEEWDWMMTRLRDSYAGQWHWTGVYQVNNSDYQSDQVNGGWTARDGSLVLKAGEKTVMAPGEKAEYEFTHTITQ